MDDLPNRLQFVRDGGIQAVVAEVKRSVLNLPIAAQMDIIRAIAAGDASFSDGVDLLTSGADFIEREMDEMEEGERPMAMLTRAQAWDSIESIPAIAPIAAKARALNPAMWPNGFLDTEDRMLQGEK